MRLHLRTIQSDRSSPTTVKCMALLLADLGVVKRHRRPHVLSGNPFSPGQSKTLKYRPTFRSVHYLPELW